MVYPGLENKLIIYIVLSVSPLVSFRHAPFTEDHESPGAFPCAPCWSVCPSSLPSFLQTHTDVEPTSIFPPQLFSGQSLQWGVSTRCGHVELADSTDSTDYPKT
jgi:hypothetical protein